ncbi:hypothetical protein SCOR_00470 [Sulfidibacter corallicola]|uniref:Uncharacterized protein n=1 Tax=Sulfidibacter corallicola TaxID=2818388 RepID=A0A8A4TG04_SULCO|nr:hypothetical protein [Sulfidibacter corallicola]QTD48999.1 hypothetical protein J3U87_25725 [Sulfidibacter corallicola]
MSETERHHDLVLWSDLLIHTHHDHIHVASERGGSIGSLESSLLERVMQGPYPLEELVQWLSKQMDAPPDEAAKILLEAMNKPNPLLQLCRIPAFSRVDVLVIHLGTQLPPSELRLLCRPLIEGGKTALMAVRKTIEDRTLAAAQLSLSDFRERGWCDSLRGFVQILRFLARRYAKGLLFARTPDALPFCDLIREMPTVIQLQRDWRPMFLAQEIAPMRWRHDAVLRCLAQHHYAMTSTDDRGDHVLPEAYHSLTFTRMEGWVLRDAAHLLCWNQEQADRLEVAEVNPERITILPAAAPLGHLPLPRAEVPYLGYLCGRDFREEPHPQVMGLVLEALRHHRPDLRLAVWDPGGCGWVRQAGQDTIGGARLAGSGSRLLHRARFTLVTPDARMRTDAMSALLSRGAPIVLLGDPPSREIHSSLNTNPPLPVVSLRHLDRELAPVWQHFATPRARHALSRAFHDQARACRAKILDHLSGR